MAAQVVSGHLEMPGHLEMTPGQSPMETEEPSARTRRRADEAEIAERGTPPKRPPPPDGNEGHLEMTGHLEMPQGGKKQLRQLSWREAYRGAEAGRASAERAATGGAAKAPGSRLTHPANADGTAGNDAAASSPCSYESSDDSSRPPTPTPSEEAALRAEADPEIQRLLMQQHGAQDAQREAEGQQEKTQQPGAAETSERGEGGSPSPDQQMSSGVSEMFGDMTAEAEEDQRAMEKPVRQETPPARDEGRGKGRLSLRPGGSTFNPFRVTSPGMKGWQLPGGKGKQGQTGTATSGGKGAASGAVASGWKAVARAPPARPEAQSAEALDLMREKQMERVEQMRQRREREELEAEEGGQLTFAEAARGAAGQRGGQAAGERRSPVWRGSGCSKQPWPRPMIRGPVVKTPPARLHQARPRGRRARAGRVEARTRRAG